MIPTGVVKMMGLFQRLKVSLFVSGSASCMLKPVAISQMLIQYNEERKDHELRQVTLPAAFKSDSMAALYRLLMGLLLSDEASLPVVIIEQTMIFEDAALSKPSFTDGVTTDRDSDGSGGSPSSDLVHAPRLLFEPSVVSNKLVHFNRMPLMDSEPTVPQQLALISSSRIASVRHHVIPVCFVLIKLTMQQWHLSPTQLGWLEEDLLGLLYRIINQVLEPESTKAMLALKRYCPEVMKCLSVALGRATRP